MKSIDQAFSLLTVGLLVGPCTRDSFWEKSTFYENKLASVQACLELRGVSVMIIAPDAPFINS